MKRDENEERKNCDRMLEKVMTGVLSRFVPYMNVKVMVKMLGRDDYTIHTTKQTTLHDYGDIGIEPSTDDIYDYLDVSINKTLLSNPNIGEKMSNLIDALEIRMDNLRQD